MSGDRDRQRALRRRGYQDGLNDRRIVFPDEPAYLDGYGHGQLQRERDREAAMLRRSVAGVGDLAETGSAPSTSVSGDPVRPPHKQVAT